MSPLRFRVLFISDRSDAPHRYRCVQACAQLRAAGALANVLRVEDPSLPVSIGAYAVIVLFRLPWGPRVERIVEAAHRHGIPIVFDCDDLVFDPVSADWMPFRHEYTPVQWEESYGTELRALHRTFQACDSFLGSTPALADWARRLGKPAHVHPNVVPDEYVKLAPLLRRLGPRLTRTPTIGYFAGSNTHDRDFESIAPALHKVLANSPDARLVLGGHLDVGHVLTGLLDRVIHLPHVSFRVLAWAYAACDVTIAPSAELNPFTDGKSALKFFEPGIFGVPVVASPTREMRRAIEHGVSGWLAEGEDGWERSLSASLEPSTHGQVGQAARQSVERRHSSRAVTGHLAALLQSMAIRPAGKEPEQLPYRIEEYDGRLDAVSRSAARLRRTRELVRVSVALRDANASAAASRQGARPKSHTGGSATTTPGVDIVVPVYNARQQTLRCLRSVLRHASGDYRLVVIDDASTDPTLWSALERLTRGEKRVILRRNEKNLGFAATCNRAFAEAEGRDVLLLNSDTRVFRGFLRQLRDAAYADDRTGIVCPLSNNATILSVPEACRANELPAGTTAKQMAALVRKASRRRRPEIVTPVGFCMYVRAEVHRAVGPFDAARFGRGFGEENDLGERAKAAGWTIRAADDTYVWHQGKASFGDAGYELEAKNAKVLEARHPGYHAAVARFVSDNPLAPIQDELRWHLQRRSFAPSPAVMMLLQASPFLEPCGGTEYVTRDLVKALRHSRVVLAWPAHHRIEVAEVLDGDFDGASVHRFPMLSSVPRFCHEHAEASQVVRELLELFRVGHVHVHHLLGWPLSLHNELSRACVPFSMTVHDFYAVCPSQNLIDYSSFHTCCPSECSDSDRTTRCMQSLFNELSLPPPVNAAAFLEVHRAAFATLFSKAARVFFPSCSTKLVVESVYPSVSGRGSVLPHAYLPVSYRSRPTTNESRKLKIALIGEVSNRSKGAEGYLDVMSRLRDEAVEWHIFGATNRFDFEQRLSALGHGILVEAHGAYARHEIVGLLQRAQIDIGLLLPIWPETFSLTLSELLAAGVPVVAARQGALEDRLEGAGYAVLVEGPEEAASQLRILVRDSQRLHGMRDALDTIERPDTQRWVEAHERAYRENQAKRGVRALRGREMQRLGTTRVSAPPARSPISTTQPAARYRSASWHRRAQQLKPYLPESIRALVRRRLGDGRLRVLQAFRLPSARAKAGPDIRIDARYLATARFTSLAADPFFILLPSPFAPEEVGAIRFNLWCSHHGYTCARVDWRHEGDAGFRKEKSMTVEINGGLADWQEYVVRLDRKSHPTWYTGKRVVELRFSPVSYAGLFCLGRIELCAPAD